MSMRPTIKHEFIIGKVAARKYFFTRDLCVSPYLPSSLQALFMLYKTTSAKYDVVSHLDKRTGELEWERIAFYGLKTLDRI